MALARGRCRLLLRRLAAGCLARWTQRWSADPPLSQRSARKITATARTLQHGRALRCVHCVPKARGLHQPKTYAKPCKPAAPGAVTATTVLGCMFARLRTPTWRSPLIHFAALTPAAADPRQLAKAAAASAAGGYGDYDPRAAARAQVRTLCFAALRSDSWPHHTRYQRYTDGYARDRRPRAPQASAAGTRALRRPAKATHHPPAKASPLAKRNGGKKRSRSPSVNLRRRRRSTRRRRNTSPSVRRTRKARRARKKRCPAPFPVVCRSIRIELGPYGCVAI